MKIRGAVLDTTEANEPFAVSRPITVRDLELDSPGPSELLVRMEAAGVCHSDLSVVNGTRPRAVPLLLGHEAAGIVEVMGADVVDITLGSRVVMTFLPRCELCPSCASDGMTPCEQGSISNAEGRLLSGAVRIHDGDQDIHHHLGVSGFATYAVVDRRSVVPVAMDVPPTVAALMGCAVLTGGGAVINAGQLQSGETLVVVGLGGVGMAAALVGRAFDDVRVIGVDTAVDKLRYGEKLGLDEAYTPEEALARGVQANLVVEAVGRASALETAIALTRPGGRTVSVGLPAPSDVATFSPLALVAQGRRIIGSYLGSSIPARDIPFFLNLWRSGRLPVERLVSARVQLSQLNEAFDTLSHGEAIRQVITFDT